MNYDARDQVFSTWSGDFIRAYSGPSRPSRLSFCTATVNHSISGKKIMNLETPSRSVLYGLGKEQRKDSSPMHLSKLLHRDRSDNRPVRNSSSAYPATNEPRDQFSPTEPTPTHPTYERAFSPMSAPVNAAQAARIIHSVNSGPFNGSSAQAALSTYCAGAMTGPLVAAPLLAGRQGVSHKVEELL